MSKGIFVTATGTDVGKTYITALLIKTMRSAGYNCGYYKAAVSGANSIAQSDAGYVNRLAQIGQREDTLLSYLYKKPVSPHLAARSEGNPLCMDKVKADYNTVNRQYDFTVVEGSGGIVCPVRWDKSAHILLEDIVKALSLPTLVVADAGLGTINATALTVFYLKSKNIPVKGVILNRFIENEMHTDNAKMIETLTGASILALVKENDRELAVSAKEIAALFEG
jgi:dethiobiotin synthetase